jgi:hypothetical protein
MKVGDLVALKMKKTQPPQIPRCAVVLNAWYNHKGKRRDIEIMWAKGTIRKIRADLFEVINESR